MSRIPHLAVVPMALAAGLTAASAMGQPSLGQIPYRFSEEHTLTYMRKLMSAEPRNRTVLVARVASVTKRPPEDYAATRKNVPGVDPEVWLGVLSGTFETVAVLYGPPARPSLSVDNTRQKFRTTPVTVWMRPGWYWIVTTDSATGEVDKNGSTPIFDLKHPLLPLLRRHFAWLSRRDEDAAALEMKAVALDANQGLLSRMGAIYGLGIYCDRGGHELVRSPRYPFLRNLLRQILETPNSPPPIRELAVELTVPSFLSEMLPGSDEAWLTRYLLRIVASETDQIAYTAASRLLSAAMGSETIDKRVTEYMVPEIEEAFERRLGLDRARNSRSPVGETFVEILRNRLRSAQLAGYRIVTRRIP